MSFKKTLAIILFFLVANFKSQLDLQKKQQFLHYQNLLNTSSNNITTNSQRLLENAQTTYEKAYAFSIMGGDFYRRSEYANAIYYLEKADQLGSKLDSTNLKMSYGSTLVMSYRRAGLIEQSNEAWEKLQKLIKSSRNPFKKAEYLYILSKIKDIDEQYCEASVAREDYLQELSEDVKKKDPDYIFATYAQLGFSNAKCGNIQEAKLNLSNADKTIKNISKKSSSSLFEIYELAQALILLEGGNKEEAKNFFTSAYNRSKSKNTYTVTKLILNERLEADIDEPVQQLKYTREIAKITKLERSKSKDLVKYEFIKSKQQLKAEQNKTILWVSISIFAFLLFVGFAGYLLRRNRKIKNAYLQLLKDLDDKDADKENQIALSQEKKMLPNKQHDKEIENEEEIVKQLQSLEKKAFFTAKNMSAAQMAVLLKITPRNLSYILKKYRGEDFYNYLNNIRINYISSELRSNHKLLHYKIAALADLCGYTSHSQFTTNFKLKTGISPSQYIQFLQKDRQ